MTTVQEPPAVDVDKLMSFVFRAVDEVGATLNTALVVMGDKLGFYTALSQAGPLTPSELAAKTGTSERYVREWLNAQAAGGYVEYQPDDGRYTLPPEQAVALDGCVEPCVSPRVLSDRSRIGPGLTANLGGGAIRSRHRLA